MTKPASPVCLLGMSSGNGKIMWEEIGEISLKEKQEAEAGLRCKVCWDHGYNLSWVDEGGFPVFDGYVPCSVCGRFVVTPNGDPLPDDDPSSKG